ncbi:MAG: FtsX-like permease family protein, partial [Acidobacteriota bacterium]|nr:FtsX-like permease family protein [Acidobacteriota bacterium]
RAAEAFFGNDDPIGTVIEGDGRLNKNMRVVGVVEAFRKDGETTAPMKMIFRRYSPTGAYGALGSDLLVRVRPGTPVEFEEQLARRLQKVAPQIALSVRPMEQMRERMSHMKFVPLIIGGIIGLFLIMMVALGLTGVLWQSVTRRTRELGLRRAMGATGASVHRQVLGEVVLLATFALAAGTVVVLQFPILGLFKFVPKAAFTAAFVSALATIYGLAVLCGLYPSWMASRLQPADALRYE